MLRWVGFIVLVVVVHRILVVLPVVGPFLRSFGVFGFWASAIVVGFGLQYLGRRAYRARRDGAQMRELEAVDSPRNRGKLGSLLAARGRLRAALPHLEAAAVGEPRVAEWRYQLGRSLLRLGRPDEARAHLRAAVDLNEEHGYGAALMRLAEAESRAGDPEASLASLERLERNHGESPESVYRRGDAFRRLKRRDEARRAFARVPELAREVPRYQRGDAQGWAFKARLAGLL